MSTSSNNSYNAFQKWGVITVVFVYLLIAIGSIVRTTGAGMGCPDWPKCFGNWVPPTDASQLPADYRDMYAQKRKVKNERLANYLTKLGFAELASKISADPSMYVEAEFNPLKTWIEYVNRLFGVLVGLFIVITAFLSFSYWKRDKTITLLSIVSLFLVGFQGWIGSIVVSTNLLPGMITLHMVLAIVIALLLIYVVIRAFQRKPETIVLSHKQGINRLLIVVLVLSFIQIVLGTQVREGIDAVVSTMQHLLRSEWIEQLGWQFYVHRSFSLIVLVSNLYLLYLLQKYASASAYIKRWGLVLVAIICIEIASGVIMAYFAIPAFLQPVHLLLAIASIGIQFILFLAVNPPRGLASQKDTILKTQAI